MYICIFIYIYMYIYVQRDRYRYSKGVVQINSSRGLSAWNFQGYGRNVMINSRGQLKKTWNFRGNQKKSCLIPMRLDFWPWNLALDIWSWNFQGVQHNFTDFPTVKLCFVQNFFGKSGICLDFFWNSLIIICNVIVIVQILTNR